MPRTSSDTRLIVFTKAPNPGAVKTRLIPLLGEAGAAALHRRLIERTLAMARAAAVGPVELHGAPDASDPFLGECAQRYGALLTSQVPGNLGARMAAAMEQTLSSARYAILIGTDCPGLNAGHIREARDALAAGAHAVVAPAEDGGYALIALARCDRRLQDVEQQHQAADKGEQAAVAPQRREPCRARLAHGNDLAEAAGCRHALRLRHGRAMARPGSYAWRRRRSGAPE